MTSSSIRTSAQSHLKLRVAIVRAGSVSDGLVVRPVAYASGSDPPEFLRFALRLGNATAAQPGFDHGVGGFGGLLLDPVRDIGQIANGEVADQLVGAVGELFAKSAIALSPDHQRGDLQDFL